MGRLARLWSPGLLEPKLLQMVLKVVSLNVTRLISITMRPLTGSSNSSVKKWQTMIDCSVDVVTTDGYKFCVFCVGYTHKRSNQIKKTSYAQSTQVRQIRAKMVDIITREVYTCDLKSLVQKLLPDSIAKDIEKAAHSVYPLHDVHISKVKCLKKPKLDLTRLMDMHGEGKSSGNSAPTAEGAVVTRSDDYEPPVQEAV